MKPFVYVYISSISLILIFLITWLYSNIVKDKNLFDTFYNITTFIISIILFLVVLIIMPLTEKYKIDIIKMTDYDLTKSEKNLVLIYDDKTKIFDTYEAVTSINDSTSFYIINEKSFYGIILGSNVYWSNDNGKTYNIR